VPNAYIRRSLLTVSPRSTRNQTHVAPDARGAIEAFRDCGWSVTVVGGTRELRAPGFHVDWQATVQERDPGAWLLTDDVTDDHWARPLGLRTALVGPHLDHSPAPARCDVEFRDLRTAALEILSSDPGTRAAGPASDGVGA
jgi:hypothetical protein